MGSKPFKTFNGAWDLLIDERGLSCPNREALKTYLSRINYYRFSGYARQFQRNPKYGDNNFIKGTFFQIILNVIEADTKLRHLLFSQLGSIEIVIRAQLAHKYGQTYGATAYYLNIENYAQVNNPIVDKTTSITKGILSDLERDKSQMIKHYADLSVRGEHFQSRCERYENVPIWVAVEVLSFGRISNMITYTKNIEPAKQVARSLNVQWAPFSEVVHALSVLRNLCTRHHQLWNRRMDI